MRVKREPVMTSVQQQPQLYENMAASDATEQQNDDYPAFSCHTQEEAEAESIDMPAAPAQDGDSPLVEDVEVATMIVAEDELQNIERESMTINVEGTEIEGMTEDTHYVIIEENNKEGEGEEDNASVAGAEGTQTIYVVAEGDIDSQDVVRLVQEGAAPMAQDVEVLQGEAAPEDSLTAETDGELAAQVLEEPRGEEPEGIMGDSQEELREAQQEEIMDEVHEALSGDSLEHEHPMDISDVVEVEVPFVDSPGVERSASFAGINSRTSTPTDFLPESSLISQLPQNGEENVVVEKIKYEMPIIQNDILDNAITNPFVFGTQPEEMNEELHVKSVDVDVGQVRVKKKRRRKKKMTDQSDQLQMPQFNLSQFPEHTLATIPQCWWPYFAEMNKSMSEAPGQDKVIRNDKVNPATSKDGKPLKKKKKKKRRPKLWKKSMDEPNLACSSPSLNSVSPQRTAEVKAVQANYPTLSKLLRKEQSGEATIKQEALKPIDVAPPQAFDCTQSPILTPEQKDIPQPPTVPVLAPAVEIDKKKAMIADGEPPSHRTPQQSPAAPALPMTKPELPQELQGQAENKGLPYVPLPTASPAEQPLPFPATDSIAMLPFAFPPQGQFPLPLTTDPVQFCAELQKIFGFSLPMTPPFIKKRRKKRRKKIRPDGASEQPMGSLNTKPPTEGLETRLQEHGLNPPTADLSSTQATAPVVQPPQMPASSSADQMYKPDIVSPLAAGGMLARNPEPAKLYNPLTIQSLACPPPADMQLPMVPDIPKSFTTSPLAVAPSNIPQSVASTDTQEAPQDLRTEEKKAKSPSKKKRRRKRRVQPPEGGAVNPFGLPLQLHPAFSNTAPTSTPLTSPVMAAPPLMSPLAPPMPAETAGIPPVVSGSALLSPGIPPLSAGCYLPLPVAPGVPAVPSAVATVLSRPTGSQPKPLKKIGRSKPSRQMTLQQLVNATISDELDVALQAVNSQQILPAKPNASARTPSTSDAPKIKEETHQSLRNLLSKRALHPPPVGGHNATPPPYHLDVPSDTTHTAVQGLLALNQTVAPPPMSALPSISSILPGTSNAASALSGKSSEPLQARPGENVNHDPLTNKQFENPINHQVGLQHQEKYGFPPAMTSAAEYVPAPPLVLPSSVSQPQQFMPDSSAPVFTGTGSVKQEQQHPQAMTDMYIHNWRPTGQYRCVLCSYSCVTKNYLFRHWLVHHNQSLFAYRCPYCDFRYTYKDGVTRHVGRWHKDQAKEVLVDAEVENEALRQFKALFGLDIQRDRINSAGQGEEQYSPQLPAQVHGQVPLLAPAPMHLHSNGATLDQAPVHISTEPSASVDAQKHLSPDATAQPAVPLKKRKKSRMLSYKEDALAADSITPTPPIMSMYSGSSTACPTVPMQAPLAVSSGYNHIIPQVPSMPVARGDAMAEGPGGVPSTLPRFPTQMPSINIPAPIPTATLQTSTSPRQVSPIPPRTVPKYSASLAHQPEGPLDPRGYVPPSQAYTTSPQVFPSLFPPPQMSVSSSEKMLPEGLPNRALFQPSASPVRKPEQDSPLKAYLISRLHAAPGAALPRYEDIIKGQGAPVAAAEAQKHQDVPSLKPSPDNSSKQQLAQEQPVTGEHVVQHGNIVECQAAEGSMKSHEGELKEQAQVRAAIKSQEREPEQQAQVRGAMSQEGELDVRGVTESHVGELEESSQMRGAIGSHEGEPEEQAQVRGTIRNHEGESDELAQVGGAIESQEREPEQHAQVRGAIGSQEGELEESTQVRGAIGSHEGEPDEPAQVRGAIESQEGQPDEPAQVRGATGSHEGEPDEPAQVRGAIESHEGEPDEPAEVRGAIESQEGEPDEPAQVRGAIESQEGEPDEPAHVRGATGSQEGEPDEPAQVRGVTGSQEGEPEELAQVRGATGSQAGESLVQVSGACHQGTDKSSNEAGVCGSNTAPSIPQPDSSTNHKSTDSSELGCVCESGPVACQTPAGAVSLSTATVAVPVLSADHGTLPQAECTSNEGGMTTTPDKEAPVDVNCNKRKLDSNCTSSDTQVEKQDAGDLQSQEMTENEELNTSGLIETGRPEGVEDEDTNQSSEDKVVVTGEEEKHSEDIQEEARSSGLPAN